MEMIDDPRNFDMTIPAQRTHTEANASAPAVVVSQPSEAQMLLERYRAVIAGYEGTLRTIRSRAQKGMLETEAVRAASQLETIDALAALALMGGTSQESDNGKHERFDW